MLVDSTLKDRLHDLLTPFLFDINDKLTRKKITIKLDKFLKDLAIFDYKVICDETNNTLNRIVKNEVWIDVAIQPTELEEFVFIPIKIGEKDVIKSSRSI